MKQYLLFLLAFTLSRLCFGQCSLAGIVTNDVNEAAAGALVQLLRNDSSTFVQFTRTDTTGAWSLQNIKPGVYVLKIAYFGSEPWLQKVDLVNQKQLTINAVLQPKPQQLNIVQISAEKLGVVLRGDTTFYNIDAFTDSTEYNLKDILNKLPGISADDGGIKYHGNRVQVVLTEGKDIFGQLHQQMTESIKAEDVAGVQIIERYKEGIEPVKQPGQDKVALNVELTEAAKNRINGEAGVNTDLVAHYELSGTAYKSGTKTGFTTLLRSNNTGQAIVAGADLLAFLDFDDLKEDKGQKFNTLMALFIPMIGTRQNNDQLAFARLITDSGKALKTKAAITFANFNRQAERLSFGIYTNENNVFTGLKKQENPSSFLNIDLQSTIRKNAFQITVKTPFTFNNSRPEQALTGLLDSTVLENTFRDKLRSINFTPAVILGWQVDSMQALFLTSRYALNLNDRTLGMQSVFPVFGLPDTTFAQTGENDTRRAEVSLDYQTTLKRHRISLTVGIQHHQQHFDWASRPLPDAAWQNSAAISDINLLAKWGLHRNRHYRFRYGFSLNAERFKRCFEKTAGQRLYTFLTGSGGLYWDFNKFHNLYFNANYNVTPPNVINLFRVLQVQDANTVTVENVDSNYLYKQLAFDLSYSNTDPLAVFDYRLQVNYSIQHNTVLYQTFSEKNYFANYSYLVPSVSTWKLDANGTYRIKPWKAALNLSAKLERSDGLAAVGAALLATQSNTQSASIFATFPVFNGLTIHAGSNLVRRQLEIEQSESGQLFLEKTWRTGLQFKRSKWFAKTSLARQNQGFGGLKNTVWSWDAELEYRLAKIPLRLRLTGRNILNLRGNQIVVPDFSFNYIGIDQFTTIGGQVLAGVSYVF